ncbi:protein FAR1-RELATED SEQUENCE 2-like isoform X2 [Ipomoea triloba]|uniref:protein FAR1-RELATED SEQUENCE 2-like isoform X2 n=1 Tax=Ipomoea triloba TaxID=35885 RepID=UPI00125E314F|nr:protein FAR1-RELATED SEQUENCE 2-like isoform X2 [Ipomoea triloba]
MEIDLELPSRVDEKLDSVTATTDANAVLEGGENVDGIGDFMDDDSISLADKGIISYEPRKDLEFETKEAAYSFYREYARSVGFGITIKASRRSKKSGKFIDVKIVCSRFGTKRDSDKAVNSRSCPKTDCKAGMHIKRKQDGKWYIYSFVKEHNHEICPDDFYYAIRGRIKQSINAVHQKKGLQLALDGEDIQAMLDNFMLMQGETPGFYYAVDFDKEKRMRNVCWVDAKGRHDYGYFSDVIFFDTTYIRKKYKVPLLPIVGVNHNFQLLLLGCGLIGDETSSTYIWLMRTWLRAVGGQSPKVVITDDNNSLQEAIDDVFPDARHCFCLWHVMEKISHHLSHKMHNFEVFLRKFNKCVYQPWSEECFEKSWSDKIVDAFELRGEECMGFLFESRKKWVPAYMRGTFLGGLCTVERSEGISSFFDNYIHKETTFKEFIDHYKTFLHDCYEEETKADFETKYKQPTIKSVFPYEKQMSTVYTHAVFKKFQSEVHGMGSCDVQKEGEGGKTMLYRVDDSEMQQKFIVAWIERQSSVYCSCHSFEYRGFLCRHAMKVLQIYGISSIPPQYVLKRWTKEAKVREITSRQPSSPHYRVQRLNDLCKLAVKLGEAGSLSLESYNIVLYALEEVMEHCVGENNSARSSLENNTLSTQNLPCIDIEKQGSGTAKRLKKKQLPKKHKVQSVTEEISSGIQDSNQQESSNPREQTLESSYVAILDMQGMELGSRTPVTDGYYSTQQSIQGLGQLASLPMLREGYYYNQGMQGILGNLNSIATRLSHYPIHSFQGMLQGQLGFRAAPMHGGFEIQDGLPDIDNSINSAGKQDKNFSSHDCRAQ